MNLRKKSKSFRNKELNKYKKYKYRYRFQFFIFDFVNGIRSGIPFCCVKEFCLMTLKGYDSIGEIKRIERNIPFTEWVLDGMNYVRCDKCYNKKHSVKIKSNGIILHWLVGRGSK